MTDSPIRIGLMGYGRMGKAIEKFAADRGFAVEWVWKAGSQDAAALTEADLQQADVVIEFTRPTSAMSNFEKLLNAGIPVVTGTTGWFSQMEDLETLVRSNQGCFFHAANFSKGVNLFFALNTYLAQLLEQQGFDPSITEIHHTGKKDAPSGTAIRLAEQILKASAEWNRWALRGTETDNLGQNAIPIRAERRDPIPGTHRIVWEGPSDKISIEHEARSREGFAEGALAAAFWLAKQKSQGAQGIFTMSDMLRLAY